MDIQTTRLAIIEQTNLVRGFSKEACDIMKNSLKDSTIKQFESRWSIFVNWCKDKANDCLRPSNPQLADFMVYLFQVRGTLPKYGDLQLHMYEATYEYGRWAHHHLNQLIEGMYQQKACVRRTVPSWDLILVLQALRSVLVEPW